MLRNSHCERNNLVSRRVFSGSWNFRIRTSLRDGPHSEGWTQTWECVGGGDIVIWYALLEDQYAVRGKKWSILWTKWARIGCSGSSWTWAMFWRHVLPTWDDVILGDQIFRFCHVSVSPLFRRLGFGIYDPPSTTVNSYWLVEWLSCTSAKLRALT